MDVLYLLDHCQLSKHVVIPNSNSDNQEMRRIRGKDLAQSDSQFYTLPKEEQEKCINELLKTVHVTSSFGFYHSDIKYAAGGDLPNLGNIMYDEENKCLVLVDCSFTFSPNEAQAEYDFLEKNKALLVSNISHEIEELQIVEAGFDEEYRRSFKNTFNSLISEVYYTRKSSNFSPSKKSEVSGYNPYLSLPI